MLHGPQPPGARAGLGEGCGRACWPDASHSQVFFYYNPRSRLSPMKAASCRNTLKHQQSPPLATGCFAASTEPVRRSVATSFIQDQSGFKGRLYCPTVHSQLYFFSRLGFAWRQGQPATGLPKTRVSASQPEVSQPATSRLAW